MIENTVGNTMENTMVNIQSEDIIVVENICKQFKENKVLNNVSAVFKKGEIHGVVGRNGSGKTMLFKCVCGFVKPTSGKITVEGKVIGKDVDMPKNVGIIIESPGFLTNFSGLKNLQMLANINGTIKKEKIVETIKFVGLDPYSKKHVGKYSMGMRQRLGIAQAIMEEPSILILDEPMNGLDKTGVEEMRSLFKKLKEQGATIILASHNAQDIEVLCDTVHEMDGGVMTKVR